MLFEDEHLIVINKPAGLTVHRHRATRTAPWSTVADTARIYPGLAAAPARIVHRLDKGDWLHRDRQSQQALVKLQVQIQKQVASRM